MASRSNQYDVPTYDGDFAAWAFHQAMLLRSGQLHLLDRAWIAEELESLGRTEFKVLRSALSLILQHMLKWDYQPQRRSWSWVATIRTQRRDVQEQLHDNPSLSPRREEAIERAYHYAITAAAAETKLDDAIFPVVCPYSWDEIMNRPVDWPEESE